MTVLRLRFSMFTMITHCVIGSASKGTENQASVYATVVALCLRCVTAEVLCTLSGSYSGRCLYVFAEHATAARLVRIQAFGQCSPEASMAGRNRRGLTFEPARLLDESVKHKAEAGV